MGWTKRDFINAAYAEIGMADYVFDLEPEQLQVALGRLDSMMATWNGRGVRLGYPLSNSPGDSDIDQDAGVPDSANEAIYTNLAMKLAPMVGKVVSRETKVSAREGYDLLLNRASMPQEMQLPGTMPLGAGHKPVWSDSIFMPIPSEDLLTGGDGPLILE